MAISQNGCMWATWYAGVTPAENSNNFVVVATSGEGGQTWEEVLSIDPDGPVPAWLKSRRLTDGVMMCKPAVLSGGEWILPASLWNLADRSAQIVVSNDRGKTWLVRVVATVPNDVLSGELESESVTLRRLVSKGGARQD